MPADVSTRRAKLERVLTCVLALFALYTIGRFGIDQIRPPGMVPNDYQTFPRMAERLVTGAPIYRPDDPSPFKYSPTFALAFRYTFFLLPLALSWIAWCSLSIAGFSAATRWLWGRALPLERLRGWRLAALLGAFGVFHWHGYIEHWSYGQGDVIVYALFIAAVAARRDWVAGAIMAAQLLLKPQSAILLAYFLVQRRFRMLIHTGALACAALAVPAALYWGPRELVSQLGAWKMCLARQSVEFLTGNLNQSVAATLARWSSRELVTVLTPAIVALGGALALAATWFCPQTSREPRANARLAIVTLLFYAVVTPLSWRWL
ncbi:MAG: DUF2029 domain-containing protein, partial [Deltaproteobacteria bacterium]|nr:DUF2029 domain-containing protein [Deltaproteobacteria bacterium]